MRRPARPRSFAASWTASARHRSRSPAWRDGEPRPAVLFRHRAFAGGFPGCRRHPPRRDIHDPARTSHRVRAHFGGSGRRHRRRSLAEAPAARSASAIRPTRRHASGAMRCRGGARSSAAASRRLGAGARSRPSGGRSRGSMAPDGGALSLSAARRPLGWWARPWRPCAAARCSAEAERARRFAQSCCGMVAAAAAGLLEHGRECRHG